MAVTHLKSADDVSPATQHKSLQLQWITGGFHNPECAVYDRDRSEIYLSSMASDGLTVPVGGGYVSRLTPDGGIIEKHWISGLKNPCGLAVRGARLYIVDCDRLLVADTATGKVVEDHPAPGATFLDGMGVNEDGSKLFVSDIFGNAIWRFADGRFEKWLEHPRLNQPDGMVAEADRLVVGGFALKRPQDGPTSANDEWARAGKGHLVAVDYRTREITDIGDGTPIANHDGLCSDGKGGYLTADFIDGTILKIDAEGRAERLMYFDHFNEDDSRLTIGQGQLPSCGPADIQYDQHLKLLFVPLLNVGKLAAYKYLPEGA